MLYYTALLSGVFQECSELPKQVIACPGKAAIYEESGLRWMYLSNGNFEFLVFKSFIPMTFIKFVSCIKFVLFRNYFSMLLFATYLCFCLPDP